MFQTWTSVFHLGHSLRLDRATHRANRGADGLSTRCVPTVHALAVIYTHAVHVHAARADFMCAHAMCAHAVEVHAIHSKLYIKN
jgi:hypothetical protein